LQINYLRYFCNNKKQKTFLMDAVELIYSQLFKKVVHHKNGIVSSEMHILGSGYESNYGLTIPVIDKIVSSVQKNNSLALYCWKQQIRESKLFALRLLEPGSINDQIIEEIVDGICNIELAEQASHVFFGLLPDKLAFSLGFLKNGSEFVRYMGLITLTKVIRGDKEINVETCNRILCSLGEISWTDKPYIIRALSNLIVRIGLIDKLLEQKVIEWINEYQIINNRVADCLRQEAEYFFTN
jgi:hypothetical protein